MSFWAGAGAGAGRGDQWSIRGMKGFERTSQVGKYYIINTYSNTYTLTCIPKRSLTRNPVSGQEAPL